MIETGDIILIEFPFTDSAQTKFRPGVVLTQSLDFEDYLIAFISSSKIAMRSSQRTVLLDESDNRLGLRKTSVIKIDKLATLNISLIDGRIGHLPENLQSEMFRKLREMFSENNL
jgi:mRNA interferase MazF